MRELSPQARQTSIKLSLRKIRRKRFKSETAFCTLDNTEDVYGTNIRPSQRSCVDPWDLENYDYVRRKIDPSSSPSYSVSFEPMKNDSFGQNYARISSPCDYSGLYNVDCSDAPYIDCKYDKGRFGSPNNYWENDNDGICTGELSSSSSHCDPITLPCFQAPYEYCDPYGSYPQFISDCEECSTAQYGIQYSSLIYDRCFPGGISSLYGSDGIYSLKQPTSLSLCMYDGIDSQKFVVNKKGLLQIDYSCSWSELDKAINNTYNYRNI